LEVKKAMAKRKKSRSSARAAAKKAWSTRRRKYGKDGLSQAGLRKVKAAARRRRR